MTPFLLGEAAAVMSHCHPGGTRVCESPCVRARPVERTADSHHNQDGGGADSRLRAVTDRQKQKKEKKKLNRKRCHSD